jgi:hypothetical protein
MKNDESEKHFVNASLRICERAERESSVTVERVLDPRKHISSRIRTEKGRQIDKSDKQSSNADIPMCTSFDSGSKATPESAAQAWKHFSSRTSIDEGIKTELSM